MCFRWRNGAPSSLVSEETHGIWSKSETLLSWRVQMGAQSGTLSDLSKFFGKACFLVRLSPAVSYWLRRLPPTSYREAHVCSGFHPQPKQGGVTTDRTDPTDLLAVDPCDPCDPWLICDRWLILRRGSRTAFRNEHFDCRTK